jgi:hypothetical protein
MPEPLTEEQAAFLQAFTSKYHAMSNSELMKKVTQYALKKTLPLSEGRMMLIEAAMRIDELDALDEDE